MSLVVAWLYVCISLSAEEVPADVLFARKIQPLFKVKCLTCHGDNPEKLKGDLDMRTRAGLLKGGESEESALVPGKAMTSPLYLAVTRAHEADWSAMPPKENDKLSAEQVGYIKEWITAGAPWPDAKRVVEAVRQNLDYSALNSDGLGPDYNPPWMYHPSGYAW